MRRLVAVSVLALAAAVLPVSATAAAPHYILVSGPTLKRPALLSVWKENHSLLLSILEAAPVKRPTAEASRRPRFDIALFWAWSASPPPTSPRMGDQHGSFYPAFRGRRAVIRLTVGGIDRLKIAPRLTLAILARHGVPTRL